MRQAQKQHVQAAAKEEEEVALLAPSQQGIDIAESSQQAGRTASGSPSLAEAAPERICRICFEGDDADPHTNPLISPCLCAGGSRYVHRKCLQQWRESCKDSGRSKAYYRCEVCHYEYQYRRLDGAALIAHPVVVPIVFTALLLLSCGILGFIPLVQACLSAYEIPYTGLVHVVVHLLDGLIILGLVGFVLRIFYLRGQYISAADLCPPCWFFPDCTAASATADCGAAAGAAGEACLFVVVAAILIAAVAGLLAIIPAAIQRLYELVDELAGATVQMVENVKSRRHPRLQQAEQQQQQQHQPQQQPVPIEV